MKYKSMKAGQTYVLRNGLIRRLDRIEEENNKQWALYTPIGKGGSFGAPKRCSLETFAGLAMAKAVST
ncbi:hypothetical protein E6C60_1993 [Paenibacillus algicola]|uniref:Uncharacterized protein n=1 Tax=Paenibacillus algicola TaxID=2565926 RepID=A0A4P8XJY6_9BACL|nr:hypothetical protein [Paenibacillus algicola]QCT02708.1 hypothetical protein E6C60_1993 [Paenibacillus algicola]